MFINSDGKKFPTAFTKISHWLRTTAINNLTGRTRHLPCPISANSIASLLKKNGTYKTNDRVFTRFVLKEVSELWRIPTPAHKCISDNFSPQKFARSLQMLKPGKVPGPDSISSELIIHAGAALKSWPNNFLSSCMHQLKIPKIWRRALMVATPKPMKPPEEAKSYRPISLLCVPFKIIERLIYARPKLIVNPLLPQEQAGFRRDRSITDQVTLLTQGIGDSFSAKKKLVLYSWTLQLPKTLYGTVVSPASSCAHCRTGTLFPL